MLATGGNAVDAAVAAAFALAVVEPSMSGLGGRTQILLRESDGEFYGIDGTTQVPARYPGSQGTLRSGYGMVGVPGTVAALTMALQEHGTMPLAAVLAPAIALADSGFPLDSGEAERMGGTAEYLGLYEGSRRYFLSPDGTPLSAGEIWRQPDLAQTLRAIAAGGRDAFYLGELATRMARDIAGNGGFVHEEDLAAYQAQAARVVRGSYRGFGLAGLSLPAAGATTIEILQILEQFDLASMTETEWAFHVVEALRLGYEDWFADHGTESEKVARIISKEWAATRARSVGSRGVEVPADASGGNTAHLTAVDENGGAVALTQSLGPAMGSRVATPGLGFAYAATMGYLSQTEAGARAASFISPFMVLRDGEPVYVLGAAGARRIVTSIVESLSRTIDRGLSFAAAVAAPRIHPDDDTLVVERRSAAAWPDSIIGVLEARGWPLRDEASGPYFGRIHGVHVIGEEMVGVADPRWSGTARAAGAAN